MLANNFLTFNPVTQFILKSIRSRLILLGGESDTKRENDPVLQGEEKNFYYTKYIMFLPEYGRLDMLDLHKESNGSR